MCGAPRCSEALSLRIHVVDLVDLVLFAYAQTRARTERAHVGEQTLRVLDLVRRLLIRRVSQVQAGLVLVAVAVDELLPLLVTVLRDLQREVAALRLVVERELVTRLAVGHLVDAEPLASAGQQAREQTLHVLQIVQFLGQRVVHVHDDQLPVGLALIDERKTTEHFHLDHGATTLYLRADLARVDRIVVALVAWWVREESG